MKRAIMLILKIIVILLITVYACICGYLYLNQEKIIFLPEKLPKDYRFNFSGNYEEINIKTKDNVMLNSLLFKAKNSKGLVFYLHGNKGSLRKWGYFARAYNDLGYDILFLDYRGYGKSEGQITSEKQMFEDVETAYNEMTKRYYPKNIIILGYSIGTALASKLASAHQVKLLILEAPYFNLSDMMTERYPFAPTMLLKYKFENNKNIPKAKCPVIIFHGNQDQIINYTHSERLAKLLDKSRGDMFFMLPGQNHNNLRNHPKYKMELKKILDAL